jgi:hypothetical protein
MLATILYVGDVRTSQERPATFHRLLGDNFNILYADDVRTSQETQL